MPDRGDELIVPRDAVGRTPDDIPVLYTNGISISMSPFDFVLTLRQLRSASEQTVEYNEVARVFLSPPHAKALAALLSQKVSQYEGLFGPLPSLESLTASAAVTVEEENNDSVTDDPASEPEQPS